MPLMADSAARAAALNAPALNMTAVHLAAAGRPDVFAPANANQSR